MILLYDHNLNFFTEIGTDELIEATQTSELNKQISSVIRIRYENYSTDFEYFGYYFHGKLVVHKIITTQKEDGFIQLTGIHLFFDELKGRIIRDKRPTQNTAKQIAETILENTGWTVTSSVQGTFTTSYYHISALEAFYKLLDLAKCEFTLSLSVVSGQIKKNLHLEETIGGFFGKWYEYGDKLLTVVAEENHATVCTAYIGRGKGEKTEGGGFGRRIKFDQVEWKTQSGKPLNKPLGQDFIMSPIATALFGYPDGSPRIGLVDFSDIEEPEKLLQSTYDYLIENCRPKLQLRATAFDDETVNLGELVSIIRPDLDIRYQTRVFKIKHDLITGIQSFEFGDKLAKTQAERFTSLAIDTETKVKDVESRLEERLNDFTINFYNEDGYNYELKANNEFGLPAGYYSFNSPIDQNPTKVVYVGAGKVLIATSKNSNGDWTWRTAITPEGVYGSEIIANSITANQLSSDIGQSLDISSNVSIVNKVSQAEYDSNGQLVREELTSLRQTTDRFQMDFVNRSDFQAEQTLNNNRHATINQYIRFIQGRIELGASGNPVDLVIRNDRMEFRQNGSPVAWFSNNQLFVTDIEVTNRLIIAKSEIRQITPTIAGIGVTQ